MSELTGPLEEIFKKLQDPNRPFTLLIQAVIKPGSMNAFRPVAEAAVKGTRMELGNIAYEFHQSLDDPNRQFLFEKWNDFESLRSHFDQSYTHAILESFNQYGAEPLKLEVFQPWME
jgi:quinol monooxygenase YgiN